MADPVNPAPNPLTTAGGATNEFAQGFSDAMQSKIAQEAQGQATYLASLGAPQSAVDAVLHSGQGLGDALYGVGGFVPGSALMKKGAAWGSYLDSLPKLQAASIQQAIAQASAGRSSGGSSGGGSSDSSGGMSDYQSFEAQMAQDKFSYEMSKDDATAQAAQDQFQFEIDKFNAERGDKKAQMRLEARKTNAILAALNIRTQDTHRRTGQEIKASKAGVQHTVRQDALAVRKFDQQIKVQDEQIRQGKIRLSQAQTRLNQAAKKFHADQTNNAKKRAFEKAKQDWKKQQDRIRNIRLGRNAVAARRKAAQGNNPY